jgi:tetratricopeptide (TPR) repeat protein
VVEKGIPLMWPLTVILCVLSAASSPEARFEEANAAYGAGRFDEAAVLYEQVIADGIHDAVVFFNLGNACFSAGRLGPAVVSYERALRLEPGFERARVNLDHVLASAQRRVAPPLPPWWEQTFFFWHGRLSPQWVTMAAALSWCAFWILLALRKYRRFAYARRLLALVAFVTLAFGISAWAKAHPAAIAVACQESVPVHYARGDLDTVHFELSAGDRVQVEERQSGWLLVSTGDGRRGWVDAAALALVGPPYDPVVPVMPGAPKTGGAG